MGPATASALNERRSFLGRAYDRLRVVLGSLGFTLGCFLVLPLIQAIDAGERPDLSLASVDSAFIPPPPPPVEDEPEEEEQEEEPPPELEEQEVKIDLSQLENLLGGGLGDGSLAGDFAIDLDVGLALAGAAEDLDVGGGDDKPRAVYQPSPQQNDKTRRRAPGTVRLVFTVNERGQVEDPAVLSSSDPVFERPALAAVRQWRFEPVRRGGKPVSTRARQTITFPKE